MASNRSKINEVIKVLDKEHGREVLNYWETKGEDVAMYKGDHNEKDGYQCIYYGIINGMFHNWNYDMVLSANATIIELP